LTLPKSVESRNLKQGRHPVNVGYSGAKQTLETAMDNEVANAGKTSRVNFPWLAAYPAGVPARIKTPPYSLLGEIAPDLAARKPAARAFTTIMPNGMAASLSFAQVDRYSDAFAAYLRETLHLEPGARVAIQIPNGLGKITPNGHLQKRTGRWLEIRRVHFQAPRLRLVWRAERKQDEAETDGYLGNVG
jgi:hypothetical protein